MIVSNLYPGYPAFGVLFLNGKERAVLDQLGILGVRAP